MRSLRPRLVHLGAFLALAVAVLCTQQWALRHWTLHAVAALDAQSSKAPPTSDRCDECTALCAFAAGAPAAEPVLTTAAASDAPPVSRPRGVTSLALRLGFRSRAPPVLS